MPTPLGGSPHLHCILLTPNHAVPKKYLDTMIETRLTDRDAMLRQYTLLTGRLNALSTYLSTASSQSDDPTHTPLSQQIITPLNPLPSNGNPLSNEAYFQALNTMPLLDVQSSHTALLSSPPWRDAAQLRLMHPEILERYAGEIKGRLRQENTVGELLSEQVRNTSEEYEWDKRVEEGDGGDEDDDDLFEDKEDEVEEVKGEGELAPNIRAGWKLADYVGYMDTGKRPVVVA